MDPDGATGTPPSSTQDAVAPARADGVQLIGEMKGSGYREPPALARRGDGQTIQLTPLLYLVLAALDGERTHEEVAAEVSRSFGRTVSADNVRTLVEQLRPDGSGRRRERCAAAGPEVEPAAGPALQVRRHRPRADPAADGTVRLVVQPDRRRPRPRCAGGGELVGAVREGARLRHARSVRQAGPAPARRSGHRALRRVPRVRPRRRSATRWCHARVSWGPAIYLVWPAFYTDVTDSYRLGRRGRVLTDLGGLYFNAIVAVAIAGIWWATQYDALLLVVATQILQMVRQLTPLVRFDGYHVLADVTGVPDLFQRIKPTLLGLLPWRWRHPETTILKPWARAVVTTWVLVVVPMLAVLDVLHGPHAAPHPGHRVGERRQAGHAARACLGGRGRPRGPGAGPRHRRRALPGAGHRGRALPARASPRHADLDGHQRPARPSRPRRPAGAGTRGRSRRSSGGPARAPTVRSSPTRAGR